MRRFIWGFLIGSAVMPLAAAIIFLMGGSSVDATADPPAWETVLARRSLSASVARQPKLANPVAADSENLRAGMKIYRDNCAGCHGDFGKPSHWGTHSFYPRVPQFASEPPQRADWQLFWIVKHGVRYTGMGAWDGEMPDQKIWTVVTFLSRLQKLPDDVRAEWSR
jgi:mono/diheme cytochrome c family protein